MTYQPSPYQTQAPSFASPLDQIVNGVQPGASSSRGALLERAYSLTRGGGAGPSATKQDAHGAKTMTAAASMHSPPLPPPPNTYASVHTPLHNYRQSSGTGGDEGSGRHGMHNPSSVAAQQTSSSSSTSDRQRVQRLREARLSQQQTQLGAQQHNNALHGKQSNDAMLSKAFRDSVASDVSFNSITGLHDRTSMLNIGPAQSAWHGQRQQASEEYSDADRIAEEVRGLAMRRRPSIDTVRSSEFGEGGRWAKAWAGSDDGQDDEEEEEMDLQAMRARDITDYDVEGRRTPQQHIGGLGALGQLGSLQGARAAMISENGAVTSTRRSNDESPMPRLQNAPGSSHTVNLTPSNSHMRSVQHFHPSSQLSSPNQQLSHLVTPATATLNRRDTIMSVSGVIEEASVDDVSQQNLDQAHARSESNATVGSAASSALGNAHVMVWPPTPAGSAAGSARGHGEFNDAIRRNSNRDTLRATPRAEMGVGQRAIVEHAEPQSEDQQDKNQHQQRALPQQYSQPISPSSLLNNESSSNSIHITNSLAQQQPSRESPVRGSPVQHEESYTGYADPNQHTYAYASDGLGKMRRKAIADHDGRESMVSDLDVETLRLDGSSASGSSSDGYDPRRDSTSTIGTVTSIQLDEQRRRRSRLERHDAAAAGYDDRRSSVATIRGGGGVGQHFSSPRVNRQVDETLASARSMGNDGLAQRHNANMAMRPVQPPKRANSQPDEQAPQLAPAPWAAKSPTMYQQRAQQPMRSASGDSIRAGLTSPPMRTAPLGSPLTSAASATTSLLSSPLTSRTTSESSVHTMQKGQRNSAGASSSSLLSVQSQAEKFLTLGISHHESGDLSRSAYNFERSAKIDGGCVVGMCMWGMALREGWGVRKDQKRGFEWISRAASRAGEMMSSGGGTSGKASRTEAEVKAIRSELKLSVYELGKCFCYGWGVKMDKQMALEYFELAARLGDADAQAEAGALLAAGKGCKKDLKKAAMYYRMAEAQGYDTVGLSWIHKDKYNSGNAATSTASNLAAR